MKAFNYNINFISEPSLNGDYDPLLETISFKCSDKNLDLSHLKYHSEYDKNGNSRLVRYSSELEFEKCLDKNCTWSLEIQSIVTFVWQMESLTVIYVPQEHFTVKQLEMWALSLLLPLKLTIEDKYDIFHASAVEINGECIIFTADCYGGKSTLTDYFVQQGYAMICDDLLCIDTHRDRYFAVPSYPHIRPYRKVEDIGYHTNFFASKSIPVKTIYILEKVEPDATISIETITGLEKFKAIHSRSITSLGFLNQYLFKKQCKMAINIPVYRVTVPWDKKRLHEVKNSILNIK